MRKVLALFILLSPTLLILSSQPVLAITAAPLISAVQVAGTTADDEFIELYNPTDDSLALGAWSIQYKSGAGQTFYKKNFSSTAQIPAHGYYLITYKNYTGSITPDLSHSTFSLSGTGGDIFLVANQTLLTSQLEASIIDQVSYGNSNISSTPAPSPTAGQVLVRRQDSTTGDFVDTDNSATDFCLVAAQPHNSQSNNTNDSSGGSNNPQENDSNTETNPTLAAQVGEVIINELVSNPTEGQPEWLELFNYTDRRLILDDWYLEDGSTAKTKLSGLIEPRGFLVIQNISGNLNNTGDLIKLYDGTQKLIDQFAYGVWNDGSPQNNPSAPAEGQALARDENNTFVLTTNPTPGQTNQIVTPVTKNSTDNGKTTSNEKTKEIIINEILPNPIGDDSSQEFIELFNPNADNFELKNWRLQNSAKNFFIISTSTLATTIIPANGFLVLYRSISKLPLDNNGDTIKLYNASKKLIDSYTYEQTAEGLVWARDDFNDWQSTKQATPAAANAILAIAAPPQLNVWYSPHQPARGEEITFDASDSYNATGGALIFFWDFEDGQTASGSVVKHRYFVNKRNCFVLKITNQENLSSQKRSCLTFRDETTEEAAAETKTSTTVKTGAANNKKTTATIVTTPEEARNLPNGSQVQVSGHVAVLPGTLGQQFFYLTGSGGLQIYSYRKDFPPLVLGEKITVTGTLSEINGEKRLKTSSQQDIQTSAEIIVPEPLDLSLDEINDEQLGNLVTVSGEVLENNRNNFVLADQGQELAVYFKPTAKIETGVQDGQTVKVTGIISKTTSGYRLLPRFNNDLAVGQVLGASLTNPPANNPHPWTALSLALLLSLFLGGLYFYNRYRRQNLS